MEHNAKNLINRIPEYVTQVTSKLEEAGFSAYLVGGCVRDMILGKDPKDWDVTTNAKPEEIIALFEKTIYENTFGTVGVCIPKDVNSFDLNQDVSYETLKGSVTRETSEVDVSQITPEYYIIEVTPYRTEAKYSDFRHPDEVKFSDKLEDDLKRRDFTVNAMVLDSKGHVLDFYGGLKDIKDKTLRTVGEADERFTEDPLRMLRAVRFSCQLGFSISTETTESILKNADLIKKISTERIRDEFVKIILSPSPSVGVDMLQKFGLLKHIIPELEEGISCEQGGAHVYDVYTHLLQALQHSADKGWSLEIRLSALFHDIGKPKTRRLVNAEPKASFSEVLGSPRPKLGQTIKKTSFGSAKKPYTFYGHEVVGARMAKKIMERLKFSRDEIDFVESMVRNHMFFSDTEQITLSAVRRIIVKVSRFAPSSSKTSDGHSNATQDKGKEDEHPIWDLMKVREADRVGMAKKEAPYRLRKYHAMIDECLRDPISVSQLKIDGNYLMNEMNMKPSPRMGWVLNALLEEVLEDPEKNNIEYLKNKVVELEKLSDADLRTLGEKAKEKKEELEEEEVSKLHSKHGVRKSK